MKKKTGSRPLFYALNIVIPLFLGLLLYLTLRKDSLLSLFAGRYAALPSFPTARLPESAVSFLRFYASDVLWAYALGFAVLAVMGYSRKTLPAALVVCVSFAGLLELLQKAGILRGTFDPLDIVLEAASVCLALLIIKKYEEAQNEKSSETF